MESFMEFCKSHSMAILIFTALLLLSLGIRLAKRMFLKKQKRKELTQVSEDKRRDENLNDIILNGRRGKDIKEVHKPYDVDYGRDGREGGRLGKHKEKESGSLMIQLVEKTELSTRKFIMNPMKPIRIGSDLQNNDITIFTGNVSPTQCEIFVAGNKVYIKNTGRENRTILKRKREKAIVDGRGVRLLSGDTVILDTVSYDITIMDKRKHTRGGER